MEAQQAAAESTAPAVIHTTAPTATHYCTHCMPSCRWPCAGAAAVPHPQPAVILHQHCSGNRQWSEATVWPAGALPPAVPARHLWNNGFHMQVYYEYCGTPPPGTLGKLKTVTTLHVLAGGIQPLCAPAGISNCNCSCAPVSMHMHTVLRHTVTWWLCHHLSIACSSTSLAILRHCAYLTAF